MKHMHQKSRVTSRSLCFLLATLTLAQVSNDGQAQTTSAEISAEERERDARALFALASRHYDTGRLAEAIEEFGRAYDLFPLPALQFNLYLAYRDSGDVPQSTRALRLYLETEETMDPARRSSLARRLETLEARAASNAATDAATDATPVETSETPVTTVTAETTAVIDEPAGEGTNLDEARAQVSPEEEDSGMSAAVGGVVLGVGGALLVGALIEGLVANGKNSELDEVCTAAGCEREAHDSIVSSFETHRNVAWGLLYAGAAVAATGVVLLLLSGGDETDDGARADLSCDPRGCIGSVGASF